MHQSSDFNLYNEVVKYEKYIRKYVSNEIPAVHRDLRIHLMDECYNLIRYLLEAQYNKGNIRLKYINEMIVTISMIDVITNNLYELLPKRRKYLENSMFFLTNIKNMTYAWKNKYNEKENR